MLITDYPLTDPQWLIVYKIQHCQNRIEKWYLSRVRQGLRSQLKLPTHTSLHWVQLQAFINLFSTFSPQKTLLDRLGVTRWLLNWIFGLNIPKGSSDFDLRQVYIAICVGAVLIEQGKHA